MSFDETTKLRSKGAILVLDGRYYREVRYKKNNKYRTDLIPIEDMFTDFIGEEVKVTIEIIKQK